MSDIRIKISAQDDASKVLGQLRGSLDQVQSSAAVVSTALGAIGIAGVGGLVALARNAINSVDALNDLRDATGASIENISALEDVAARTGTSFDAVQTSLIKLNKVITDAQPGSATETALNAIGLSVKELKELDPAEALLATAKALNGFADDGNKARIVQELFGKSLKEVAPLLKDLADKGALYATVTTQQAEAAEKFNKELFNIQKNATDLGRSISGPLVESINRLIEVYRLGTIAGKGYSDILKDQIAVLFGLDNGSEKYTKRLAEVNAELAKGDSRLLYRNALLREQADLQNKIKSSPDFSPDNQSAAETARLTRRRSIGALPGIVTPAKASGTPKEQIGDAQTALASYVDTLGRALEKTQDLTETEKALNFLRAQGTAGQIPQVRELVLGLAEQVDAEKELVDTLKLKRAAAAAAGDELNKQNEAYQQNLASLLAATPTALLEKQREDVAALTAEFEAGRISEQLYLEAVTARLDLVGKGLEDTKDKANDLGLTFVSAFEDAIVRGQSLSDVLKGIGQDIARIAVRKSVTEPASNFLSGLVNQSSSFLKGKASGFSLSSLFGTGSGGSSGGFGFGDLNFEGGGFTGTGPRFGGLDGKGGFMAMLHPQETVVDHAKGQTLSNGGGSVIINQTINIDSRSDQASIMAAMFQAKEMAKSEILNSRSRGGVFA
jgi:hypothetical protein